MLDMKYFVLKPKGMTVFADASRQAMRTFANYIYQEDPSLAKSLSSWADMEEKNAKYEEIEINLDDNTFNYIARTAYELDITFNQCCVEILKDYIESCENGEVDCSNEDKDIETAQVLVEDEII